MKSLRWNDGSVDLLDQTLLPWEVATIRVTDVADLVAAIKRLSVRGAPALGVAGAYGVVLASLANEASSMAFAAEVNALRTARPTAVNLAKMVDRVAALAEAGSERMLAEADAIAAEELAASIAMGNLGADHVESLVGGPVKAMTICNTGGLATVERGTALAVIQTLHERGTLGIALPLETRPLLQGSRLTTWELQQMGAPYKLIVDSAGPFLLSKGAADVVLIGADRIAANGDTANKIGSFSLALAAKHAGVPFIVVAPESTIDEHTAHGSAIEIEDRGSEEIVSFAGVQSAASGSEALNPAFDVTPASLISTIVTEARIIDVAGGEAPCTSPQN